MPYMKHLFLLTALLACAYAQQPAKPQTRTWLDDPGTQPRKLEADFQHLKADIAFRPRQGQVYGKVWHTFRPLSPRLDSLKIDAQDIIVGAVLMDGKPLRYTSVKDGITIQFDQPLSWNTTYTIMLEYEATPTSGIYFIGWNDERRINREQIWSISPARWIPAYYDHNDKYTVEMIVRFHRDYHVQCNGALLSRNPTDDSTLTWHYRLDKPISSYLIMIAIGKYQIEERHSQRGIPHYLLYYPDRKHTVETTYRYSTQMMDWLEQELGLPYPWASYAQSPIQDYMYGAMETATSTVYGDFYHVDSIAFNDRSYVSTNCHELVHQWFGDYVTHYSGRHIWLNESFATYYAKKYEQSLYGEDYYQYRRHQEWERTLAAAKVDGQPVGSSAGGVARWYPKGSLVLDMLRYTVGEEPFRRTITRYLKEHPYSLVHTHDFYRAFFDELGQPLDWFFDQWVLRGGEPHYRVQYDDLPGKPGERQTDITIAQIHPTDELVGLFRMPIDVAVHYQDGTADRQTLWVEQKEHKLTIPNPKAKKIAFVLFDPGRQVLKQVTFDKGFEELARQAIKAPHLLDRYDALKAMENMPLPQKRNLLVEAYYNEKFFMNKAEVVRQLAPDTHTDALAVLADALQCPDIQVRKAAAQHLDTIHYELRPLYERLLTDSSYEARVNALENLSRNFPTEMGPYMALTDGMIGWRGQNVRMKWLEVKARLAPDQAEPYLKELTLLASPSYEFETRRNALQALLALKVLPADALPHLFSATLHWNNRLADPAGAVLQGLYSATPELKSAISQYFFANSWTAEQKDRLQKWMK